MKKTTKILIIVAIILIIGGFFVYRSSTQTYCWPYCPSMNDIDRDEIQKSALEAQLKDWKTYKDTDIRYPADWTVEEVPTYSADGKTVIQTDVALVPPAPYEGKIFISIGKATCADVLHTAKCVGGGKGPSIIIYTTTNDSYVLSIFTLITHISPETKMDSSIADWKTYTNEKYGFEFKYPAGYGGYILDEKVEKQGFYEYQITKIVDVSAQTNVDERVKYAYVDQSSFYVTADDAPYNVNLCLKEDYKNQPHKSTLTKVINGNTFYVFQDKQQDAAMGGQRGVTSQYRILHNNSCYMLHSYVYWHEIGYAGYVNTGKSDATAEETQAQKDVIKKHEQILDEVLSTFKFIK